MRDRLDQHHAIIAARQAARTIILRYYHHLDQYEWKEDLTPVTIADRKAEQAIREILEKAFPNDGMIGEELPNKQANGAFSWIIDPIDGTKSFICGVPVFGSLIGLAKDGQPLFGSVDHPALDCCWTGGTTCPTRMNGMQVSTRGCKKLREAVLCSTTPEMFITEDEQARFQTLARMVRFTRYGLDCYHYGLLASGKVDLVVEAQLKPYDFMAPAAVVLGAGGAVSDWQGNPIGISSNGQLVAAANQDLLEQALEVLG